MPKKRVSLGFFLLSMIVISSMLVMGCKPKEDDSGQITLQVLNYYDMTSANAAEEISRVWDAFERANPDIKIVREDLFNEPFHSKTESYAAAGQMPDVMYAWPSGRSTTLHTQRLLKDLGPFIQKDGLSSMYSPVILDPSQQASNYLGILSNGTTATNAFFINMEVLNDCGLQPARNYSELKAQVPVLRAKGYETILMANAETWVMQSCLFSLVAGRFCGDGWWDKIINGQAKFTDPDFVGALEFIKAMYDDGVLSRNTLTTDYGEVIGQFATNQGAYYIDGDWRVGAFITDSSTGQALISPAKQRDIRITVFPDIDFPGVKFNKSNSVILATGYGMSSSIPAGSAKEEAAWRLVKWLEGREVLTYRLETGGVPTPSRTDINFGALSLEPMQVAIANLGNEYDRATAVIDGVFEGPVYEPLNDGLQAIGMGRQTPQQVASVVQSAFDLWKSAQ